MIVTCPGCSSNYRVRNESVPEGGAKMRCPKCQTMFLAIAPPGSDGPPTPDAAPSSSTPEPISGIYDLSNLRAPTPGDHIPFASTRPSGANPKLAPPQLTSFPPTTIPPGLVPPRQGSAPWPAAPGPATPAAPAAPPAPSTANPFLGTPRTNPGPAWPQGTSPNPASSGAVPSGFPSSAPLLTPSAATPMSLADLAASSTPGRAPLLSSPYAAPPQPTSSPFSVPQSQPFSSRTPPMATPLPTSGPLATPSGVAPNAPLPPRHAPGTMTRTSSLVGVLGSDLFPTRAPDGPTLPHTDPRGHAGPPSSLPRSGPIGSSMVSDAPAPAVDPFAVASSNPELRSSPGVPRERLQTAAEGARDANFERVPQTGSTTGAPRAQPLTAFIERPSTPPPPPIASFASWLSLAVAVVVLFCGGLFSAWTAGIVDLDAMVLPVLETRFDVVPPRSFVGRDDVTVDELVKRADLAKARGDVVAEGMWVRRARAIAPLDGELERRMGDVSRALGLPRTASR